VVGLGIALGFIVGLGTWILSGSAAPQESYSMAQPAAAVPPDVMAPTLGTPAPEGSAGLGQAPAASLPPAGGAGGAGPTRTPVTAQSSPAAPPVVLSLTARYATRTAWNGGYIADIFVTNPASVAQSFAVRLDLPRNVSLTNQVWNATPDGAFGTVTFRGGPVIAGQTLQFGFVGNTGPYVRDTKQLTPTACTVNGNICDGFSSPPSTSNYPPGFGPWWSAVSADGVAQNRKWRLG
jgi:hypothetical protein